MLFFKRFLLVALAVSCGSCGPSRRGGLDSGFDGDSMFYDAPCPTAIVGKVFAPNGTLPLYNVLVYVPEFDPPPFTPGVQCQSCADGIPGNALAQAVTDAEGKFRIEGPGLRPGTNVPVIITTGKWRRRVSVPVVGQCVDNIVPDGMFRLPRNKSEGELPKIAVVAGGCDDLGCILPKIGIDASEFGDNSNGTNSVTFYLGLGTGVGAPGSPQPATALWGNLDEMKKFDIIINTCECSEENGEKTSPDLLRQYADLGGRVFGSHFHYTWQRTLIPQWQGTANWTSGSSGTPALVDQTHSGGMALAKWLVAAGASTSPGQVNLGVLTPAVSTVTPPTLRWLYSSGVTNPTTHYLSFQTPVGKPPAEQCGKVVYAGLHVASGSVDSSFPANCGTTFTADEKALVFLLFDLGACVSVIF